MIMLIKSIDIGLCMTVKIEETRWMGHLKQLRGMMFRKIWEFWRLLNKWRKTSGKLADRLLLVKWLF